jgi:putative pyruvate formate lyase activating enzyme
MSQYLPLHKAREFPELSRAIVKKEYKEASALLDKYGLTNGWIQAF